MGTKIKNTSNELKERWHSRMPRFFYWLVVIACGIGGTAFSINTAVPALGGTLHEWWQEIYSYIIGGCVGIVCVCKFTVAGGYKKVDPDALTHGNGPTILDHDIDHLQASNPIDTTIGNGASRDLDPIDGRDL